ncbi:MAG: ABC transporter permease [Kofleriaceae bacterium]
MLVALLEAIGLGALAAVGLGLLTAVVFLVIAFVNMGWVALLQWRDVISFDRWTEVMITIGRSKLRTALTLISVAWGIFVLVFLLGLGRGLNNGVRHKFARDAINSIMFYPNKTSVPHRGYDIGRRITLVNRDYEAARKVAGVEHISGAFFISGTSQGGGELMTKRGGKANAFQINAVNADKIYVATTHRITQGRFLTEADIAQRRKAVVIGQVIADYLFPENPSPMGEWIEVANVPFQVIGVFSDANGPENERQLYIPVSTAQLAFNGQDHLGMLEMTVGDASAAQSKVIADQVLAQLAERHQFDPADLQAVRVRNTVETAARFSTMFFMISVFVVVIGLGTLAAGVVGVSNIMMIAVKERTKEIGVRKALGATPNSIVFMIVQEAVFLTGVAGLLGLSGGVFLLDAIGKAKLSDVIIDPSIDLRVGVIATLFLMAAGALAGYFPARAAARINPIHALRDQ